MLNKLIVSKITIFRVSLPKTASKKSLAQVLNPTYFTKNKLTMIETAGAPEPKKQVDIV
jgi:hypothetical protein